MTYDYSFKGVCARGVSFDIDEDFTVSNVKFSRGCPGNTEGIAKLASGRNADELINALIGTTCETKSTSCPDQFAMALIEAKEEVLKSIREKKAV
ncbi:TIGR03905 family TSCPD domain-containing protein [Anaeropeptidivorans aminofermentans]|jgi:uncharacterized protein (TIGR03905 family)|uniref:TIGR03905 family TSCPD domain-containing protein n=1 Tax=Anaeropeptidivorans aminofermentans TaxID=2934315 RepID=UPI002024C809|nr:TIGR03905 family TSCPD domain-containing protein [Anaeropeptidivorans aminofermentans]MBE6012298.1 TIGR03905 family TSCPD domain-containing protein [Lachnospiraceae bacterium]